MQNNAMSVFSAVCLFVCVRNCVQSFAKFSVHIIYGRGSVVM